MVCFFDNLCLAVSGNMYCVCPLDGIVYVKDINFMVAWLSIKFSSSKFVAIRIYSVLYDKILFWNMSDPQ